MEFEAVIELRRLHADGTYLDFVDPVEEDCFTVKDGKLYVEQSPSGEKYDYDMSQVVKYWTQEFIQQKVR